MGSESDTLPGYVLMLDPKYFAWCHDFRLKGFVYPVFSLDVLHGLQWSFSQYFLNAYFEKSRLTFAFTLRLKSATCQLYKYIYCACVRLVGDAN